MAIKERAKPGEKKEKELKAAEKITDSTKTDDDKDKKKVKLLLNESYPDSQKVVPDPYYGDFKDFEHTYRLVEEACEIIAKRLSK